MRAVLDPRQIAGIGGYPAGKFTQAELGFKPFWSVSGRVSGSSVGSCRPVGGRRRACSGSPAGVLDLGVRVWAHWRERPVSRAGDETLAGPGPGSAGPVW